MQLKWLLFGIVMAFDGLFLAALGTKYLEVKRASRWPQVRARIVSSRSEARKVERRSGAGRELRIDTDIRNFAAVTFAFEADGRRHTSRRISIAEDVGNVGVAEKLAKYPVGAEVAVYFNRDKPAASVLERDMSMRSFEIALLIGGLVALAAIFYVLVADGAATRIALHMSLEGRRPPAIFAAGLALLVAVFANTLNQRGAATKAWPRTTGTVLASATEAIYAGYFGTGHLRRKRWVFRTRTAYRYQVNGVGYQSDRTSYGVQSYASAPVLLGSNATPLIARDPVDVYYDPASPTNAVRVTGAPGQWMAWATAALLLAVAVWMFGGY